MLKSALSRKSISTDTQQLLLGLLGIWLFMSLSSYAFNGYEQERMRWGWQAIYILFAAYFLDKHLTCLKEKRNDIKGISA
jgi:hypothetical protein